jgi:hypothetical protein
MTDTSPTAPTAPTPSEINFDYFPCSLADITDPDSPALLQKEVRVLTSPTHYYFFIDGTPSPLLTDWGALYDFDYNYRKGHTITTEDQRILFISPSASCGCGSTLRTQTIFQGVPRVR